jgi:hypothetical protein
MSDEDRITKREVKNHIDECIIKWREIRDDVNGMYDDELKAKAPIYIDAFQSLRHNIIGNLFQSGVRTPDLNLVEHIEHAHAHAQRALDLAYADEPQKLRTRIQLGRVQAILIKMIVHRERWIN